MCYELEVSKSIAKADREHDTGPREASPMETCPMHDEPRACPIAS